MDFKKFYWECSPCCDAIDRVRFIGCLAQHGAKADVMNAVATGMYYQHNFLIYITVSRRRPKGGNHVNL